MTKEELQEWQDRLFKDQVEAAAALNAPLQTYRNWLKGRADVPKPVERLCVYVERYGVLDPAVKESR
ncbi:hypothetical protein [Azospirillum canadense]|uniref:hypothetical protein n=1 Tax=Azospirillum canadense TaxID=403962 RepID=UPI002226AB86|nr:hypothetical protein [Azospirillum canadense]MCW2240653.1 hypothetical protein [Azospirillum canadense]